MNFLTGSSHTLILFIDVVLTVAVFQREDTCPECGNYSQTPAF